MPGSFALQTLKQQVYLEQGHTATTASPLPATYQPANVLNQRFHYYRYKSPTSLGSTAVKYLATDSEAFLKWAILQMTEEEFTRLSTWKPLSLIEMVEGHKKSGRISIWTAVTSMLPDFGAASTVYHFIEREATEEQPRNYAPEELPRTFTIPDGVLLQQCSSSTACDTGIVNDLVVFKIECATRRERLGWWDAVTQNKFAFSGYGIFKVETMALCPPKSI
eukprot:508834_1